MSDSWFFECDCGAQGPTRYLHALAVDDKREHEARTGHVDESAFLAGLSGFTEGEE